MTYMSEFVLKKKYREGSLVSTVFSKHCMPVMFNDNDTSAWK